MSAKPSRGLLLGTSFPSDSLLSTPTKPRDLKKPLSSVRISQSSVGLFSRRAASRRLVSLYLQQLGTMPLLADHLLTSIFLYRSVLSSDHLIYFLKLIVIVLLCFLPVLGVKVSLIFVLSLPAFFCFRVKVRASRPE